MSETSTNETPAAPKKNRKAAKKRAKPAAEKAKPATGVYAGLTVHDCCTACGPKGCVITNENYCGHPRKGGLHAHQQQDQGALQRRREAEKFLGEQKLIVK